MYVAHPPAARARGLRHCHRRAALRPRVLPPRLPPRRHRAPLRGRGRRREGHRHRHRQGGHRGLPRLLPSHRRGQPLGRPLQGPQETRLGSLGQDLVRAACQSHGRRRRGQGSRRACRRAGAHQPRRIPRERNREIASDI